MSNRPRASTAVEGARKPLRRSGTPFDRRTSFASKDPFQLGADLLRLNVDSLVSIYKETLSITDSMMKGGKANTLLAWFGTLIYTDLLHGGAYTVPVNERPFWRGSIRSGVFEPGGTKYDPIGLQNLPSEGLGDWIAGLFAGTAAKPTQLFDEVIINANCPHIFPKLLSDEAYGVTKLGLAYASGTDLFKSAATGISTLVEAETKMVSGFKDIAGGLAPKVSSLLGLLGAGA